jgi:hypothetical protein
MGKHGSMPRPDKDLYPTPPWPTEALVEHIEVAGKRIWEPACGRGDMAETLRAAGARILATDIEYPRLQRLFDFTSPMPDWERPDGIVTNPPGGERNTLAVRFVELAIERIGDGGFVAMLLPNDFDCAAGRRHLFAGCPVFYAKPCSPAALSGSMGRTRHPKKTIPGSSGASPRARCDQSHSTDQTERSDDD